jgi:hypothetical protein
MDSVILVHEVIHSLKSTRTLGMLIKLDLSKAFDHLSWKYMHSLLLDFGFSNDWVNWILNLTSSIFSPSLSMVCLPSLFPPPEGFNKVIPSLPSFFS